MAEQQSAVVEWVDPKTLKPHELSLQIYGEDGFEDLVESIRELGILQPIHVTLEGIIISGHRRWQAAQIVGKQVPVIRKSYTSELDEKQAIIELNRYRIKTGLQLYNEGIALKEIETERAKQRQEATLPSEGQKGFQTVNVVVNFPPHKTRDAIARTIGLGSGKQWDKLEYVAEHKPELLKEIKPSGATINQVYVQIRRSEVKERIQKTEWPTGKYRIIYADPPWQYTNTQPDYHGVQDDHYPTMPISEICLLPVKEIALDDSVLFLWATSPVLEDAFKVINAWGFKYKASFVWYKVKHNMGHYNSVRHEFLLVAVRGSCQPDNNELIDSVQTVERTDHSAKPEKFRTIIDTLYPYGNRIELFARAKVDGWEQYGNQIS